LNDKNSKEITSCNAARVHKYVIISVSFAVLFAEAVHRNSCFRNSTDAESCSISH